MSEDNKYKYFEVNYPYIDTNNLTNAHKDLLDNVIDTLCGVITTTDGRYGVKIEDTDGSRLLSKTIEIDEEKGLIIIK